MGLHGPTRASPSINTDSSDIGGAPVRVSSATGKVPPGPIKITDEACSKAFSLLAKLMFTGAALFVTSIVVIPIALVLMAMTNVVGGIAIGILTASILLKVATKAYSLGSKTFDCTNNKNICKEFARAPINNRSDRYDIAIMEKLTLAECRFIGQVSYLFNILLDRYDLSVQHDPSMRNRNQSETIGGLIASVDYSSVDKETVREAAEKAKKLNPNTDQPFNAIQANMLLKLPPMMILLILQQSIKNWNLFEINQSGKTVDIAQDFLAINPNDTEAIKEAILKLPKEKLIALKTVLEFFAKILEKGLDVNSVDECYGNLAIVLFGENVTDANKEAAANSLRYLIENFNEIFQEIPLAQEIFSPSKVQ